MLLLKIANNMMWRIKVDLRFKVAAVAILNTEQS